MGSEAMPSADQQLERKAEVATERDLPCDLRTKHPPTNNRLNVQGLQELKIHISRFS